MAKEKKQITTKPKKERKYSIEELRERKSFMTKVALWTLGIFAVLAAIIVPVSLATGQKDEF